jgi:hypothetical protein
MERCPYCKDKLRETINDDADEILTCDNCGKDWELKKSVGKEILPKSFYSEPEAEK